MRHLECGEDGIKPKSIFNCITIFKITLLYNLKVLNFLFCRGVKKERDVLFCDLTLIALRMRKEKNQNNCNIILVVF